MPNAAARRKRANDTQPQRDDRYEWARVSHGFAPAFARYGLKPCIASVEKCWYSVKELETAQRRVATSIPADARLP